MSISTLHAARRGALTVSPQQVIGYVNGKPVRAIAGGAPDGDGGTGTGVGTGDGDGTGGAADGAGSGQNDAGTSGTDKGFPENTPVDQMQPEQQAAYWKHQARKHEDRSKRAPSQAELDELKRKAVEFDKVEQANKSELERANDKSAALEKDLAEFRVKELRQRAAREVGLSLEDADFITAADLETAKDQATRLKERIGTGTNGSGSSFQQGYQGDRNQTTSSVASGRELYRDKHAKK
jgi:hypothetical protein